MNRKNILIGVVLVVIVLSLYFVLATIAAPAIWAEQNVTAAYDEGNFTINWTAGAGDAAANYTLHFWMHGGFINSTDNVNTSTTGYAWSNGTEANYTFSFSALNASDAVSGANSTNISIYVDATAPVLNWTGSGYTNNTYKQNDSLLTLNISVGDALSGVASNGSSYCLFDINGTNESVMVVNGWCNTTQLNLTGLADGNHSIDVWANDTVGNVGVNLSSYTVWVDSTAPVATYTCTPSSVNAGQAITCVCSGTDTGVGVNSSLTTSASVSITTNATVGTFTTTDNCTITDYAGNTHNATTTYTTTSDAASDASSSTTSSAVVKWTQTYPINDDELKDGFTKQVAVKGRMRFKVNSINHYAGVLELTATTAKIEVASTPQEATLAVGDSRKFNVNNDEYYDVLVTLNSIADNKADLTLKSINELVTEETEAAEVESEGEEEAEEKSSMFKKWWFWLIVVLVVIGVWYGLQNKKKEK